MYGVIEGFRAALIPGRPIDFTGIGVSLLVATLMFFVGALYFRKTQRVFADIV